MSNDASDDTAVLALSRALRNVGYSRQMAYRLSRGLSKPKLTAAANLESRLGIPARAWTDGTAATEFLKAMAARAADDGPQAAL